MSEALQHLYHDCAWLWPVLSPPESYAGEARGVHRRIQAHCKTQASVTGSSKQLTLLELGSGGGHLLSHLRKHYTITATDLSPDMLALSQKLNPDVNHHVGDMRSLRLRKKFDIVLIHDALGYLLTLKDLQQAIRTARMHLQPGGLLLLLPDEMRETFADHQVAQDVVMTADDSEITLVSHATAIDDWQAYELTMLFLIKRDGTLRIVEDRHRCGLFGEEDWRRVLAKEGFKDVKLCERVRWRDGPVWTCRL